MFLAGVATFAQLYSTQGVLTEIAREEHVSASMAALTVSATTLGVAIGVIPWSFIADRLGSRRSLMIALAAAVLPGFAGPLIPDISALVALRFVEGLCLAGVPAIAMTFILGSVERPHHLGAAAVYISGTTIGGLSGRLIAGPIAELAGWRLGVLAVMATCALATVAFVLLLPRTARSIGGAPARGWAALRDHLRDRRQLAVYAIAFLSMGCFVSIYNYLGFRLAAPPYLLAPGIISLLFVAYLAGTWSSSQAGKLIGRLGRVRTVLLGASMMVVGVAVTVAEVLPLILVGLVIATAGFFIVHAVASSWAPELARTGRNQASALYNLSYYAGSSLMGWATGFVFIAWGWTGLAAVVVAAVVLLSLALVPLRARTTH
ncbi:MFS transporter [Plantibacter flavus]